MITFLFVLLKGECQLSFYSVKNGKKKVEKIDTNVEFRAGNRARE